MSARRQTLPSIILRYGPDEETGLLTWMLSVSDGQHSAEPVKITPETAAGIAQVVDVALPLPLDIDGEATSAERVVRLAHVQTLETQLAAAHAGLKGTVPVRAATSPAASPASAEGAAPRPPRTRRSAPAKGKDQPAPDAAAGPQADAGTNPAPATPVLDVTDGAPILEVVVDGDVPVQDEPPLVDEPPRFGDLPEVLPRRSHLVVPDVDEF